MIQVDEALHALSVPRTRIRELLDGSKDRIIIVQGPTGSGRTTLAVELEASERAVLLVPPGADEIDGPIHALYQLASHLPPFHPLREEILTDGPRTLRERARDAASLLGLLGCRLIVLLGASWSRPAVGAHSADSARAERAREFLAGLVSARHVSIVFFTSPRFELSEAAASTFARVKLDPLRIQPELIDEPTTPIYGEAARALRSKLSQRSLALTPLQIRVAIGLLALGDEIDAVTSDLEALGRGRFSSNLGPLERRLEVILKRPALQPLREGLARLAQSRYPLKRKAALDLARVPAEHESLITDCVGFGNGHVRMNEFVRRIVRQTELPETADTHDELAAHHRSLEDALDPLSLNGGNAMRHWLEKVHHLAHGGESSRKEWKRQTIPSRDFYWDLAWAMSYMEGRHRQAADVYRRAIERFGEDSYSCHYYAFNLDRAGVAHDDVEAYYRRAIELDPDNPWWNGRLVTYLIDQARFDAARDEWFRSLDRVDPEREVVGRDDWLATHLHRWVVIGWLEAGEVERAREAFDEIPRDIVEKHDLLLELKDRLLDAEEARELGESVYPADTPFEQRWKEPRIVPSSFNESPLTRWYPGRVVLAEEDRVDLVVATPAAAAEERRVIYRSIPKETWDVSGWCPASEAHGFVEVGVYGGGNIRILPVVGSSPSRHSKWDHLRYLRQW